VSEAQIAETQELSAFECCVKGWPYPAVINARSAGKAKSLFLRLHLDDTGIPFTRITCRRLGPAQPPPPTQGELAQREADAFNAVHPVGTVLRYWSGVKEGAPTGQAPISHPATVMCDHAVIWLAGVSSCHSISHVEAAPCS